MHAYTILYERPHIVQFKKSHIVQLLQAKSSQHIKRTLLCIFKKVVDSSFASSFRSFGF